MAEAEERRAGDPIGAPECSVRSEGSKPSEEDERLRERERTILGAAPRRRSGVGPRAARSRNGREARGATREWNVVVGG